MKHKKHEQGCECGCGAEDAAKDCQCKGAEAVETAEQAAGAMCANEQAINFTDLMRKLNDATAAAEKNKDLYLRAMADLDTYKRKVQREKQELAAFAIQPFIEELLPSLDHLDMAIESAKSGGDSQNLIVGVEMVRNHIKKVFENYGVEEVGAVGKDFDPNFEECMSQEPSDELEDNKVVKVVRKGYTFKGRLLRPASVVVSSGKAGK